MSLNSIEFFLFFCVVFICLRILGTRASVFLLLANYFFYSTWNLNYLPLIFTTTLMDYFCGIQIERQTKPTWRKTFLWLSLAFSLSILFFYKYAFDLLNAVHQLFGRQAEPMGILVPIGLSFHTFQSMGYILDVYRKKTKAVRSFIDYANFVSFFPQLIAGPIERANHMIPQLKAGTIFRPRAQDLGPAFYLIFLGLFMTHGLAENLARYAIPFFELSFPNVLEAGYKATKVDYILSIYAFVFTLYLRFAGYSYLAKGFASLLGIDLTLNFKYPFYSCSLAEFWGRWHISLSKWIRDYIFFPLSRYVHSDLDLYAVIFVTMWVFGFWHQATFGWLLASSFLATYSIFGHIVQKGRHYSCVGKAVWILVTFHVFVFAMILVNNLSDRSTVAQFILGLKQFMDAPSVAAITSGQFKAVQCILVALFLDAINYSKKDIYGLMKLNLFWRTIVFSFMLGFMFLNFSPENGLSVYFRM